MAKIARLGRELGEGQALEVACTVCGHVALMSREAAISRFGAGGMITQVRRAVRCAACGKGNCDIDVVEADGAGRSARARTAGVTPFPVEKITFAVCEAAGWSVYGSCGPCRMTKALYAAGALGAPKAPGRVISRAFNGGKLVCAGCGTPFEAVVVSPAGGGGDVARWG